MIIIIDFLHLLAQVPVQAQAQVQVQAQAVAQAAAGLSRLDCPDGKRRHSAGLRGCHAVAVSR